MSDTLIHDVLIAGAGPVGLFLACELRRAGASVLILEKSAQPDSPLKAPPFGMRGLSAPTIDALYHRGLLDEFVALRNLKAHGLNGSRVSAADPMQPPPRPAGHFAGIQFFHDKINTAKWPYRIAGPAPTNFATTMLQVESILVDLAISLGVNIRRGCGVEGFDQSADMVTVLAGGEHIRARWLVGCDGGRSVVRKTGKFEFTGTEPEFTGYSVQVTLNDPEQLAEGRHYTETGMYLFQKPGIVAMVDFDGGVQHRSGPLTADHVQSVLQHVSGTEVTVTSVELGTTWTDRAYQATTYRQGRVLLAGDAAHIHSPLGGQGLNLGLGDAMNLGWKLGATIRGDAPDGLLDSYTLERHPIGAQVLDWSRAQVALMRPSKSTRALETIIRELIDTSDGATYFAERVWGVALSYDLGGTHPLVGRSVPDFKLADGTRIGDHLHSAKGFMLDFYPGQPLRSLALCWPSRIAYLGTGASDTLSLGAVLVRPDGIVAWVGEAVPDEKEAFEAAQRWFGRP
ncbi:2-polyprenyl-6-methoxyphenol hydroxylase-like FAD-dependent oxidoreductase [Oxalobacteraceae bacterium GrIS 1.11]